MRLSLQMVLIMFTFRFCRVWFNCIERVQVGISGLCVPRETLCTMKGGKGSDRSLGSTESEKTLSKKFEVPFRNKFRFALPPNNNKRASDAPSNTAIANMSRDHDRSWVSSAAGFHSNGKRGVNIERSDVNVVGGSLLDEEGEESKSRVADFTRRYHLKRDQLQIRGEILYGLHSVLLALKGARRRCFRLFIKRHRDATGKQSERQHIVELAKQVSIPVEIVNNRMLDIIATGHVHQGVCMDVEKRSFAQYSVSPQDAGSLWLVLDHIQDPMNFGAVLRSAFYFGVNKLLVNQDKNCRLSPVVSKASAGVMELMDVYGVSDVPSFLEQRKQEGFVIVGTHGVLETDSNSTQLAKVVELSSLVLNQRTILVIGSESQGISSSVQELCDYFLSIPQLCPPGLLDSLNVSVATGILLHHITNTQRT